MITFLIVQRNHTNKKFNEDQWYKQEILNNYRVQGSSLDIIEGLRDLSKSALFTAIKISTLMVILRIIVILECQTLSLNDNKFIGIDINDYVYYLCPNPDNYYDSIMKIKTISFLFGMMVGSIKLFI